MPEILHINTAQVAVRLHGPSADSAASLITYSVRPFDDGILTDAFIDQLATGIDNVWAGWWPTFGLTSWSYNGVIVAGSDAAGLPLQSAARDNNVPGVFVAPVLPPGCCYLVRKNANVINPGRKPQGRWFFPGVSEATPDDAGKITPAGRVFLQGLFNNLITRHETISNVGQGAVSHMVMEYKATKTSTQYSVRDIASFTVDDDIHWLKKRSRF